MSLRKEHSSALELFFKRKGLYTEDGTTVRVLRRFITYIKDISI